MQVEMSVSTLDSQGESSHEESANATARQAQKTHKPYIYIYTYTIFTLIGSSLSASGSAFASLPFSVRELDLSQPPSVDELIAASRMQGQLFPDRSIKALKEGETQSVNRSMAVRSSAAGADATRMHLDFARAVQAWNAQDYQAATEHFGRIVSDEPGSVWRSESLLFLGSDANARGRYREAEDYFREALESNETKKGFEAKMLRNKARSRLALLQVQRNRIEEARELFRLLKQEGVFWRERTFAATWLLSLSRDKAREVALMNCGTQALAELLRRHGKHGAAHAVQARIPENPQGYSMQELAQLAEGFDYRLEGRRIELTELTNLPTPAILRSPGNRPEQSGHYWIVEEADQDMLTLFDPQQERRVRRKVTELDTDRQLDLLLFAGHSSQTPQPLPGIVLAQAEMQTIFGGYPPPGHKNGRGRGRNPRDRGPGGKRGPGPLVGRKMRGSRSAIGGDGPSCRLGGFGAPDWAVTMTNMNLYMYDIPLWYSPQVGPAFALQLSYNSQSSTNYDEPFGNKWLLSYHSYLLEQPDGSVTVVMPDGREDTFAPDGLGAYLQPYLVHNRLTKLAEHHFELRFPDDGVYEYAVPEGLNSTQPRLTAIRDAYGQAMTFTYNAEGRLIEIVDALGQVSTLTYNAEGLVERVDDPFGRFAAFEYDAHRNLVKLTDMGGYWTALSYDGDVYLSSLENPRGRWEFLFEPTDGIAGVFDPYPAPGAPMGDNYRITVTNPEGGKEEYYYHSQDWKSWYVSPGSYVGYVDANTSNAAASVPKTVYEYLETTSGGPGEIRKISEPEGSSVTYGYDPAGNRDSVTDALGRETRFTFNEMGRITSLTTAAGRATTFSYAPNGVDLEKISDPLGTVTLTYGPQHQVLSLTDRLDRTTRFSYNEYGQPLTVTDPLEQVTTYGYDGEQNLTQIAQDGQELAAFTYDPLGRVATQKDAGGLLLDYGYDDLNHVTDVLYPDGRSEQYSYSGCCPFLMDSMTDRGGRLTLFEYDAMERPIAVTNPEQGVTRFQYDADWNLSAFTDPEEQTTRFEYDAAGRLRRKIYQDERAESWDYDLANRVERYTNARNTTVSYGYDQTDHLKQIDYSDGTPDVTYTYDEHERLHSMTDGIGAWMFDYDAESQLTSVNGPWDGDTLSYGYDALGRQTSMTPETGTPLTYVYDALSRLREIQLGAPETAYRYAYTGVNPLVQSLTRPNGSVTSYSYDLLNRLEEIANVTAGGDLISKHSYTYTAQDLRGSETIDGPAIPPLPELTPQTTGYTHNSVNQLLSTNTPDRNFDYDADGNLLTGTTAEGYVFTAQYDAENRMTSLEYNDSAGVVHRTEYAYSGDDLVAEQQVYENGTLVETLRIVRDGMLALQDRDGNNAITREYTWGLNLGGGIGGLLNLAQNGQNYAYLYDGKGNVGAVLDETQAVVAAYRYDPFGKLLAQSGTFAQPFRFSTKRFDPFTGLSYYGYRFYSPDMGRWTTRDPLGESGGINLYAFVENNPLNWRDPWGLDIDNSKGTDTVFYKDEDNIDVQKVEPGKIFEGYHDGVIEPSTGDVYKTRGKKSLHYQDDVRITKDGKIRGVNKFAGSRKVDEDFRKAHKDWEELFKKADEIKKALEKEKEKKSPPNRKNCN